MQIPPPPSRDPRILIFRALSLGDMLCVVPALRALRGALPQARISLCGLAWAAEFAAHFPRYIDEFIEFPGYPGLTERSPDLFALPSFLKRMQDRRFDLAIQLHGSGRITNPLVASFGARRTAGHFEPGSFCPDAGYFLPYADRKAEIWRHIELMTHLGFEPRGDHLEFHVGDDDDIRWQAVMDEKGIDPDLPLILLHPGANAEWRRWPPSAFARLGDSLHEIGCQIGITGSRSEAGLVRKVTSAMKNEAHDLAGSTPGIGVLAAAIRHASLLVSGDTGVAHLACAVDCPSVVIFMRSDQEGWPPLDRVRHRVVCRPGGVRPDDVIATALDVLDLARPRAGAAGAVAA